MRNHQIKTLKEKNEETSVNKMDTWLGIYESLTKRVGGQEKQRQLGADGINTVEKTYN